MSRPPIPTAAEDPALYANRHGQIISASVALLILPTILVALRVVSRCMSRAGFWVCSRPAALVVQRLKIVRVSN